MKTHIILPDGSCLGSGTAGAAIESLTLTQTVNAGEELTLGSVCAAMAELTVLSPEGLQLQAGEEFTLYRDGEQVGVFIAQEPVRTSANRLKLTAYDRVSLLDRDLSGWLESLTGWPYSLEDFCRMVCTRCGVALKNTPIPNGNHPVKQFQAGQVTGRQLLQWAGQVAGRFCRADREGVLEFAWYTPKAITLAPAGEHYYFAGSLQYRQYQVAPVAKVQLRRNEDDVGTVYPDDPENVNTYVITGNPLLPADSAASVIGIAQTLYEQLCAVTYTPCKVSVAGGKGMDAGDILTVHAADGSSLTLYVMSRVEKGERVTLSATGSENRSCSRAVNQTGLRDLAGRVLTLKTAVDGLQAENRDAAGNLASLQLDVAGIASEVARQRTDGENVKTSLTALTQRAEAVDIRVQSLTDTGVARVKTQTGFTFDDRGLTISQTGSQMENLLDETGMHIRRSGNVILQADQDGVAATDVTVRNYLVVGDHARFEDYAGNRTACYWI